jgi:hypothetical protein
MSDREMPKTVMGYNPEWKMRVGSPRDEWINVVENDVSRTELEFGGWTLRTEMDGGES